MNILISEQWLKEHLKTNAKIADIQKYLSLSGPSVERLYEYQLSDGAKDTLFDIEVTTNRVDMMSIAGIAREAATILERAGLSAQLLTKKPPKIKLDRQITLALPEIIYETDAVRRVTAVVLDNINKVASPQIIQDRLKEIDCNVHDVIIDITNYITHELGHPCHVFDYDTIMQMGGKIIIKEAVAGKKFVTLDGEEHQTLGGEIVFENSAGEIIDLPAVKGTANSGLNDQTKRVLFWIESLDAKKVRFASMSHAIRTIAAQLNEKNVDPHLAATVLARGVELMKKLAGAQVASEVYDYFPARKENSTVNIAWQEIYDYLGVAIPVKEIVNILENLGCQVKVRGEAKEAKLKVVAPSYRPDITISADVIEEVARIYGYHNLPSKLIASELPVLSADHDMLNLERKIKHLLADWGWQEIYSYSLVSETEAEQSGYKVKDHLALQNPLKEENTYLRRSIIPSLLSIYQGNPQAKDSQLFEIARTYQPQKADLPKQDIYLSLLSPKDYRQVKGDLEALLNHFYALASWGGELVIEEQMAKDHPLYQQSAKVLLINGKERHFLGHLDILTDHLVAIELKMKNLLKVAHRYPQYQPLSKQAAIIEQLTFTIGPKVPVGDLIRRLNQLDQRIEKVELLDVYQQNHTFNIVYRDKKVNLSSQDVEPLRQKLVAVAQKEFKAQLVGTI